MFDEDMLGFAGRYGQADVSETDLRRSGMELAQAYIPFQTFNAENLFSPEEALLKGTIFPELYRPYEPWRACKGEKMAGAWV